MCQAMPTPPPRPIVHVVSMLDACPPPRRRCRSRQCARRRVYIPSEMPICAAVSPMFANAAASLTPRRCCYRPPPQTVGDANRVSARTLPLQWPRLARWPGPGTRRSQSMLRSARSSCPLKMCSDPRRCPWSSCRLVKVVWRRQLHRSCLPVGYQPGSLPGAGRPSMYRVARILPRMFVAASKSPAAVAMPAHRHNRRRDSGGHNRASAHQPRADACIVPGKALSFPSADAGRY